MAAAKVLIVDDERSIRKTLRDILEFENYTVDEATDGLECVVKIKQNTYDVIILDIKMPKMDGMDALERIQELAVETPVVMISGHATIDTAVDAVKKGAFDFISKPPDLNRLLITIRNAIDKSSLITEKKVLQKRILRSHTQEIIGGSKVMELIKSTIERVAPTDARVLITGANGTGKELVARWIHEKSQRNDHPLVEVNCAAIPSELIESELFGHEKGSFTSAVKQRIGKFELANGGTIFLDEVGDMSLSAQAKVLRALQENRVTRVGGEKEISVNVRVIAATNKDLQKEIATGKFREDLYHRLAVIIIDVPPLKDRLEDIPILVDHFNEEICQDYGVQKKTFTPRAFKKLQSLNWTGNIRELRNVVERLIILSSDAITDKDIDQFVAPTSPVQGQFRNIFKEFQNIEEVHRYIDKEYESFRHS
ncbi:MAG TPA: sigma-54 dependent transcriptional regulator [Saprospiraceae bacterium]|nr:sigma-54 dependent transcriptional regulator [Saprospiraceae bacterium]